MVWGLPAVDAMMLAVMLVSVGVGLSRGVLFEVMSLLGWVLAYFAARRYASLLEPQLPFGAPGSVARHAAGFVVVFIVALLGFALLSRLLRLLVRATPLSLVDRLFGAAFGALRGVVLLWVVAAVVTMTPAVRSAPWQQSQGAAWLQWVRNGLEPLLPGEFRRYLPV